MNRFLIVVLLAGVASVPAFGTRLNRSAKRHRHQHVLSHVGKSSYRAGKTGAKATYKASKAGAKKVVHVTKKVV